MAFPQRPHHVVARLRPKVSKLPHLTCHHYLPPSNFSYGRGRLVQAPPMCTQRNASLHEGCCAAIGVSQLHPRMLRLSPRKYKLFQFRSIVAHIQRSVNPNNEGQRQPATLRARSFLKQNRRLLSCIVCTQMSPSTSISAEADGQLERNAGASVPSAAPKAEMQNLSVEPVLVDDSVKHQIEEELKANPSAETVMELPPAPKGLAGTSAAKGKNYSVTVSNKVR